MQFVRIGEFGRRKIPQAGEPHASSVIADLLYFHMLLLLLLCCPGNPLGLPFMDWRALFYIYIFTFCDLGPPTGAVSLSLSLSASRCDMKTLKEQDVLYMCCYQGFFSCFHVGFLSSFYLFIYFCSCGRHSRESGFFLCLVNCGTKTPRRKTHLLTGCTHCPLKLLF